MAERGVARQGFMLARSSDTTIIHLSFNETDMDRIMPEAPESTSDMADNESVDVDVPDISLPVRENEKSDTQRFSVVGVRALV